MGHNILELPQFNTSMLTFLLQVGSSAPGQTNPLAERGLGDGEEDDDRPEDLVENLDMFDMDFVPPPAEQEEPAAARKHKKKKKKKDDDDSEKKSKKKNDKDKEKIKKTADDESDDEVSKSKSLGSGSSKEVSTLQESPYLTAQVNYYRVG